LVFGSPGLWKTISQTKGWVVTDAGATVVAAWIVELKVRQVTVEQSEKMLFLAYFMMLYITTII
jgi:hypothetical protein